MLSTKFSVGSVEVIVKSLEPRVPVVATFCDPKSGDILVPAIAAFEFISAFTIVSFAILAEVTTPLSIVNTDPEPDTVISPLSPSLTPAAAPISATVPSSFLVNKLALSVRNATSPTTKSLACGSLPEPLLV